MLSTALSAVVLLGAAAALTAVLLSRTARRRPALLVVYLASTYVLLGLVAWFEIPLHGLPFWSRDFSLTWTVMVVGLGLGVVWVLPRAAERLGGTQRLHRVFVSDGAHRASDSGSGRTPVKPIPLGPTPGNPPQSAGALRFAAIPAVLFLLTLYWWGAELNLRQVNTAPDRVDQGAYLNYAASMVKTDFAHIGNRNRMPLYPFLLAVLTDPAQSLEAAFAAGKTFSLALSVALLLVLGIALRHRLRQLEAAVLLLITAFTLYAYRAPYVQAELLFYTLSALLFMLMIDFFSNPTPGRAVTIGILAGLAHLTKASILPALVIFLTVVGSSAIWGAVTTRPDPRRGTRRASLTASGVFLVLIIGFFLLTVFPYIKNSWYRFGRPFYNVNSTFYIWYDSWAQVEGGTKAHGDRGGWPLMPAEEIPSLQKYLREHTPVEIARRLETGFALTLKNASGSNGYAGCAVFLTVVLATVSIMERRRLENGIRRWPALTLFLILYFGVQALGFAWFADMVDGNRLFLALLLPLLISLALAMRYLLGPGSPGVGDPRRVGLVDSGYFLLLVALGADILLNFIPRIGSTFGGT